jgi:hypothetical protein
MRMARKAQAAQFAANVLPIIRDIHAAGFNAIARRTLRGVLLPKIARLDYAALTPKRGDVTIFGGHIA